MRFEAERTLGKLAKWLRLLGFDTRCESETGRDENGRERILLTRTRRRWQRSGQRRCLLIEADSPFEQLREVIRALSIEPGDIQPFSRCIVCNTPIAAVEKSAVRDRVPDYVWETQEVFRQCRSCLRVYWSGTHTERSRRCIAGLFGAEAPTAKGRHATETNRNRP
jgi:uncharacterized protein with PIN domain